MVSGRVTGVEAAHGLETELGPRIVADLAGKGLEHEGGVVADVEAFDHPAGHPAPHTGQHGCTRRAGSGGRDRCCTGWRNPPGSRPALPPPPLSPPTSGSR